MENVTKSSRGILMFDSTKENGRKILIWFLNEMRDAQ